MTDEITPRLSAARGLIEAAEHGELDPFLAVAGAIFLVRQALEWAYGMRP